MVNKYLKIVREVTKRMGERSRSRDFVGKCRQRAAREQTQYTGKNWSVAAQQITKSRNKKLVKKESKKERWDIKCVG